MGGCTGCMGVCVGDWRGAAWCGSKDHWVLLQLGSRVMVNYEMGAKPNLICPATPAADGPRGGPAALHEPVAFHYLESAERTEPNSITCIMLRDSDR